MKNFFLLGLLSLSLFACSTDDNTGISQEKTTSITLKTDYESDPEAAEALRLFFNELEEGQEIIITYEDNVSPDVKIKILCKYLNIYSGTVWGYGQAENGDYYFYTTITSYNSTTKKIESKTTGHKVDKPQCF